MRTPASSTPALSIGTNWFAYAAELTADNLEQAVLASCRSAADAGFEAVELPLPLAEHLMDELDEPWWADLGGRVRELGVMPHSVHGPNWPDLEADRQATARWLERYARYSVALGARVMVAHPTRHSHPHVCAHVPKLLERDADLARHLSDCVGDSLVLAIENLPTYGLRYLAALMDRLHDCSNVGVCFDTGHWHLRPEYSLEHAIGLLAERIEHLHLSDNHGLCDEHRPPGEGTFDWRTFLRCLPGRLFDQPWMVELSTPVLAADPSADERDRQTLARACTQTRSTLANCGAEGGADPVKPAAG